VEEVQAAAVIPGAYNLGDCDEADDRYLEDLYDCYERSLFRYAYAITRSAEHASDRIIESQSMRNAFAELPAEQRELLVLRIYDQMSLRDIAEAGWLFL